MNLEEALKDLEAYKQLAFMRQQQTSRWADLYAARCKDISAASRAAARHHRKAKGLRSVIGVLEKERDLLAEQSNTYCELLRESEQREAWWKAKSERQREELVKLNGRVHCRHAKRRERTRMRRAAALKAIAATPPIDTHVYIYPYSWERGVIIENGVARPAPDVPGWDGNGSPTP